MQIAKQLSAFLVNEPGRLSIMLNAMNKSKIILRALSVMDCGGRGTIRFVPDDFDSAVGVLEAINVRYEAAEVLLADVSSHPNAICKICSRLADEHLNIDYAYSSLSSERGTRGGGTVVVKVNDLAKAERLLSANGSSRRKTPGRRPVHAR